MRNYFLWALFLVAFCMQSAAQQVCTSFDYQREELRNNLSLKDRVSEIEGFIQQKLNPSIRVDGIKDDRSSIVTIPVVVHILYNNTAQNVPDAFVINQIRVLNECFRRLQADTVNTPARFKSLAADCQIEFKLAISDPLRRATTGIVRKYTPVTLWNLDDKMKFSAQAGDDAWDSGKYLNIWVCNLNRSMGYASFPGGEPGKDGVVLSCGAFRSNETIVHETGHWLGLRHIWGDEYCGDDAVADTPKQSTFTSGCPSGIRLTCNGGPAGDMYMNYMDITSDACTNLFTQGQKARMRALFEPDGPRVGLLHSSGLLPPLISEIPLPEEPPQWFYPSLFPNPASGEVTLDLSYDIRWVGNILTLTNIEGRPLMQLQITAKVMKINLANLKPGTYLLTAKKEDGETIKQKLIKM